MAGVAQGCLLLADISGATRYEDGVEHEHSPDILADLLGVAVDALAPAMPVVRLEGEAVLCAGEQDVADGAALLEALEAAYLAFARRRRAIALATSCPCAACRHVEDLDLRLLVAVDPALARRALEGGAVPAGYALLTDRALARLGLDPGELGPGSRAEGEPARLLDLAARWETERRRRMRRVQRSGLERAPVPPGGLTAP